MQAHSFDFTCFLFSLLMSLGICTLSEPPAKNSLITDESSLHLVKPTGKTDYAEGYDTVLTKLTLVLLSDDSIFAYEGAEIKGGQLYNYKNIRRVIKGSKKKFGTANLVVFIKPTKNASYKNTVDILDEMTINGIEEFHIADPSDEEIKYLPGNKFNVF